MNAGKFRRFKRQNKIHAHKQRTNLGEDKTSNSEPQIKGECEQEIIF